VVGVVAIASGSGHASCQVVDEGVVGINIVGVVVIEEDLSQAGVAQGLPLVAEQVGRHLWVGREDEHPQVGLEGDPTLAESEPV
jgi:hypothetical protein